jgi:hypothetical protein
MSYPSSAPDLGPDPQKYFSYQKTYELMFMFDDKALKKLKNPPPETKPGLATPPNAKDL